VPRFPWAARPGGSRGRDGGLLGQRGPSGSAAGTASRCPAARGRATRRHSSRPGPRSARRPAGGRAAPPCDRPDIGQREPDVGPVRRSSRTWSLRVALGRDGGLPPQPCSTVARTAGKPIVELSWSETAGKRAIQGIATGSAATTGGMVAVRPCSRPAAVAGTRWARVGGEMKPPIRIKLSRLSCAGGIE
jgi:hypothetical protein